MAASVMIRSNHKSTTTRHRYTHAHHECYRSVSVPPGIKLIKKLPRGLLIFADTLESHYIRNQKFEKRSEGGDKKAAK